MQDEPSLTVKESKNKKQLLVVIFVISFLLILCGFVFYLIFIFLTTKKEDVITEKPSLVTITETPAAVFKFLEIEESKYANELIIGQPEECQPENFDPKIDNYRIVEINGTPSRLYEIEGFTGGNMMIDGWQEEGEDKIILEEPYAVTVYKFGCASSLTYVIELEKSGKRQALYNHVTDFSFSEDKNYLFVRNSEENNGQWILDTKIVNIKTASEIHIKNPDCTSRSFWQNDRLLTYTIKDSIDDFSASFCIWDSSAELLSRFDLNTALGAGSGYFLIEPIGLLPNDLDVAYTYTTHNNYCALFLVDINTKDIKTINIEEKQEDAYYCAYPKVEFDFSNAYFNKGSLQYRIELTDDNWSNWKEIKY